MARTTMKGVSVPRVRQVMQRLPVVLQGDLVRLTLYFMFGLGALYYNWYGAPEYWFSDELIWVAEGMLRRGSWDPSFFNYPAGFLIYATVIIYRLVAAVSPLSVHDPDVYVLIVIARSICATSFVAMIWFVERTVCVLFDRQRHLLAVVAAGSSCAFIHHAHIATAQAVTFMFLAAGYWAIADTIRTRSSVSYYRLAFLCGLAVGAKYNALFLGAAALPVMLWYIQPPSGGWKGLLTRLFTTPFVCAAGALGTNPYIVLNFQKFQKDVLDVAIKEAPHFQGAASSFWRHAGRYGEAFFTRPGFLLMIFAMAAFLAINFYALVVLRNRHREIGRALERWALFSGTLFLTMVSFSAMQYSIAIHQSRYYIPLGLQFLLFFLTSSVLAMKVLDCLLDERRLRMVRYRIALPGGIALALLLLANGFLHVAAFPLSASERASGYLHAKGAHEGASLSVISVSKRSPVLMEKVCAVRCSRVVVGVSPPAGVDTWDAYLQWIVSELHKSNPNYIVLEEIAFHWAVFLPKALERDYSRRFDFPNPGRQKWTEVLKTAGYEFDRKFARTTLDGPAVRWLNPRLASTIEGIGGEIYVFRSAKSEMPR